MAEQTSNLGRGVLILSLKLHIRMGMLQIVQQAEVFCVHYVKVPVKFA